MLSNEIINAPIIILTILLLIPDSTVMINKTPYYSVTTILQNHCNLDTTLSEKFENKRVF